MFYFQNKNIQQNRVPNLQNNEPKTHQSLDACGRQMAPHAKLPIATDTQFTGSCPRGGRLHSSTYKNNRKLDKYPIWPIERLTERSAG